MLVLCTTLAFALWPVKKKDADNNINMNPLPPLVDADKLYENGYYEECYNLLSEHQVRYAIWFPSFNMVRP